MKMNKRGQGIVEYLIIVAIIALAAIAIIGIFGDTIRNKLGGAVSELGGNATDRDQALQTTSQQYLRDLQPEGTANQ